jgi:hypothetical protein
MKYARSGDVMVAYQVTGEDNPVDLVHAVGSVSHLELFWDIPEAAWLIERRFGSAFKLDDVPQVLGFLVASAAGAAAAAVGAAVAVSLVEPTASALTVWRLWFAACSLGIVTVAPLLIGLGEGVRELPPRRELIEGTAGLVTLAVLSVFVISLPQGPWATALPVALVFPLLLWIAVRCRPVFAAAAAFVVALAVICSATFNMGHFGDASVPLADRILAAQTLVLAGALLAFVLAALFATGAGVRWRSNKARSAFSWPSMGPSSVHSAWTLPPATSSAMHARHGFMDTTCRP